MNEFDLVDFMYSYNDLLIQIKKRQQESINQILENTQKHNLMSRLHSEALYMNFGVDNPFVFSSSQANAIREINKFLNEDCCQVFLLKGYAGTGKTAILNFLNDYLLYKKPDTNFEIMAPTGKAALVLNGKIGSTLCSTIHRGIYDTSVLSKKSQVREENEKSVLEQIIDDTSEKLNEQNLLKPDNPYGYSMDNHVCFSNDKHSSKSNSKIKVVPIRGNILDDDDFSLFIFDEASMISNNYSEMTDFRFGTGFLLDDIFTYTQASSKNTHRKIIFCGDPAQLWPVGMSCSPALSSSYLSEHYNVKVAEIELIDILRQSSDSAIAQNAYKIRQSIICRDFSSLNLTKGNDVFEIYGDPDPSFNYCQTNKNNGTNYQDLLPDNIKNDPLFNPNLNDPFMEAYLVSVQNRINNHTEVITYSNKDALVINNKIRGFLFGQYNLPIQCMDKLIIRQNAYVNEEIFVFNGEFVQVKEILSEPIERLINISIDKEKLGDNFASDFVKLVSTNKGSDILTGTVRIIVQNLRLRKYNCNGEVIEFDCTVLINDLYSPNPDLSIPENMAITTLLNNRRRDIKRDSKNYYRNLQENDFAELLFNSIKVRYGYAITCHKAQGSEWDDIFLYGQPINSISISEEKFHWYYTALTRAKKRLFIFNPPHLTKFSNIKIIANNPSLINDVVIPTNPEIYATNGALNNQQVLNQELESCKQFEATPDPFPTLSEEDDQFTENHPKAILDLGELCMRFGISSVNSITGWLLIKINNIANACGFVIDNLEHFSYQERYHISGGSKGKMIFNIFYSGKNIITNVNVNGKINLDTQQLINNITRIKGDKYIDTASSIDINSLDPRVKEIFVHFKNLGQRLNLMVILKAILPYTLQIAFSRSVQDENTGFCVDEYVDANVYYKDNFRVSNFVIIKSDSPKLSQQIINIIGTNNVSN